MWSAFSPTAGCDTLAASCAPSCDLFDLLFALDQTKPHPDSLAASTSPPFRQNDPMAPEPKAVPPGIIPARPSPPSSRRNQRERNHQTEPHALVPVRSAALSRRHEPTAPNNESANRAVVRASLPPPPCRRRQRNENDDFKQEVINDMIGQIDYQTAWQHGVVDLPGEELAAEMRRLSTRALIAWYEAFLYIRSELLFFGFDSYGFKAPDRPREEARKLIENGRVRECVC
jgi:hypothetical protein